MHSLLKISVVLLGICFATAGFSQRVSLIKINELNKRISEGGDTIYIINLWATWCAPCIEELPGFEQMKQQYGMEKMKILLLTVDFKSELNSAVLPFVRKKQLKNEVLLLNEEDAQAYINRIDSAWSGSIPATLFIQKGNRLFIEKQLSYSELVSTYQSFKNKAL